MPQEKKISREVEAGDSACAWWVLFTVAWLELLRGP